LDRTITCVDNWVKIGDDEAFPAALRLIRTEALLVGGSSGSALAGALKWLKSEEGWTEFGSIEGKNVVVLLPDGYVAFRKATGWPLKAFTVFEII
jgi:cystathionine beta-synthase